MFRKHMVLFLLFMPAALSAGELKINVQSFPPGLELRPGVAVLLSVEGLEPGQTATWHRVAVEGDVILKLDAYHLFAGVTPGPRTFIVQVSSPGTDPFALTTFEYGEGDDDVNPPDPPLPPGEKMVVSVMESYQPNPTYVLLIAQLSAQLDAAGRMRRMADPNDKEAGKTPAWLKVVLDKGLKGPVLAVVVGSPGGYAVVAAEPWPKTLAEANAFLKKHGAN